MERLEPRYLLAACDAMGGVFTVDSLEDNEDAVPGDGTAEDFRGDTTLRAAIDEMKALGTAHQIEFSVSGTITIDRNLPDITPTVLIDGDNKIEITGERLELAGPASCVRNITLSNGITLLDGSDGSTVRGAKVGVSMDGTTATDGSITVLSSNNTIGGTSAAERNLARGISIFGNDNTVVGNYVGLTADGTQGLANIADYNLGIVVHDGDNNRIGGPTAAERNVVGGYRQPFGRGSAVGIEIVGSGSQTPKNTLVQGNYVGTDKTGTKAIANGVGIRVFDVDVAEGQQIVGNLVSGNVFEGISIIHGASNVDVRGNIIGLAENGTDVLRNGGKGIQIAGSWDNTIGGTTPQDRNIISANGSYGILFACYGVINQPCNEFSTDNRVIGNYIGTDLTGQLDRGNEDNGILVSASSDRNTIGGPNAGEGNLVSGNASVGIYIWNSDDNRIQGNVIGLKAPAAGQPPSDPLGNGNSGVFVVNTLTTNNATGNLIGGPNPGEGNVIAHNASDGVSIFGFGQVDEPIGNAVLGNSIFSNADYGIDLELDRVTVNDVGDPTANPPVPPDGDTGANNRQNFPVLTISVGGEIRVVLNSTPDTEFRIELFESETRNPRGHGDGEVLLGAFETRTDGDGRIDQIATGLTAAADKFITATATRIDGGSYTDTSEFSQAVKRGSMPTFTVVTHGFQPNDDGDALDTLALAIVERTGGHLVDYSIPSEGDQGDFVTPVDTSQENNVVLFDWAVESNELSAGWAEAAGDALFALLVQQGLLDLSPGAVNGDMHFIAHSFGAAVNSEVVERLAYYNVPVDHLTYLDPHDFDESRIPLDVDGLQRHFDLGQPQLADPANQGLSYGATVWNNVEFADTYYQNRSTGNLPSDDIFPEGRPILGSFNFFLDDELPDNSQGQPYSGLGYSDHSWVWNDFYRATVTGNGGPGPDRPDEVVRPNYSGLGYAFSQPLGGADQRPAPVFPAAAARGESDGSAAKWTHPDLDATDPTVRQAPVWNPMEIVNGDFDGPGIAIVNDIVPGWSHHGGGGDGDTAEENGNYFLQLDIGDHSRTHNWLYVPHGIAGLTLEFDVRRGSTAATNDELAVCLAVVDATRVALDDDPCGRGLLVERIDVNTIGTGTFEHRAINIPASHHGKVRTLTFAIDGHTLADSVVDIDNVRFGGGASTMSFSGRKYEDLNGNGVRDPGEEAPPDRFTIRLVDELGNQIDETLTDPDGTYRFDVGLDDLVDPSLGLTVFEVEQPGYQLTGEPDEFFDFRAGASHVDLDFGNFRPMDLSGIKFEDMDGDGVYEPADGDRPIPGWTIFLDINNDDAEKRDVTTDANGKYQFTEFELTEDEIKHADRTFVIEEDEPQDWFKTFDLEEVIPIQSGLINENYNFGNFRNGAIHGYKYEDVDGNRMDDSEPRIGGVEIRLDVDADKDGEFESFTTEMTDPTTGEYWFLNLGPGRYRVTEILPDDMAQLTDNPPVIDLRSGEVHMAFAGQAQLGTGQRAKVTPRLAFGNAYQGAIHGYKYEDLDGLGGDNLDPRMPGVEIVLDVDLDRDGAFEREFRITTDENGLYWYTSLTPGRYRVREITPAGHQQTTPDPQIIDLKSGEVYTAFGIPADVGPNQRTVLQTDLAIGNFKEIELGGVKFADLNQNGMRESNESALSGWTIQLDEDNDGSIDRSAVTGVDGRYSFDSVGPGTHKLSEVQQPGYVQTAPAGNEHLVTATSGEDISTLDFGNRPLAAIVAGTKYHDLNRDGDRDVDEPGIPGWIIYFDTNNDGVLNNPTSGDNVPDDFATEPWQPTDANGNYSFAFPPGAYAVRELAPPRWVRTQPSPEDVYVGTIDVQGEAVGGLDFGNFNDPPVGSLVNPTPDQSTNVDLGYVDVRWTDPLPTEQGIDPASIDPADILIETDGVVLSIDRVESQGDNVYRYFYADDDDALRDGNVVVTLVGGEVLDTQGVAATQTTESFSYQAQPVVGSVLDVTGSGDAHPFRDGVLIVRFMLEQPPTNLEDPSLIPSGATRVTGTAIHDHLQAAGTALDINGDGKINPFQDGILIVRYLLEQPDANLEDASLIPMGSTRTTGAAIRSYLDSLKAAPANGDRLEPNDSFAEATEASQDQTLVDLSIHDDLDVDFFMISVPAGTVGTSANFVEINFTHSQADLDLELLDSNGAFLDSSESNTDVERISLEGLDPGIYFVVVYAFDFATTEYTITFDLPEAVSLPGDRLEANNSIATATQISRDQTLSDLSIHDGADEDFFEITVPAGTIGSSSEFVEINFTHAAGDLDLELQDPSGVVVDFSETTSDVERISLEGLGAGTYYVRVYGFDSAAADYAITFDLPETPGLTTAGESTRQDDALHLIANSKSNQQNQPLQNKTVEAVDRLLTDRSFIDTLC